MNPSSETAPRGSHAWTTQAAVAKGIVHPPEVLGPNPHPDAGAYQHDDPAGPWVPGCTCKLTGRPGTCKAGAADAGTAVRGWPQPALLRPETRT